MLTKENNNKTDVIGKTPTNEMAHQSGMDAIDLAASGEGQAVRQLHSMTPSKRHIRS